MTLLQQFLWILSFFTRIPLPKGVDARPWTLAQGAWAFPVAGAVVGALTGIMYMSVLALGVSHMLAGWLAVGFSVCLTGGLHEDGLTDTADGLAHGRDREQKLAIMRDSRIGTYGVLALVMSMALRADAITSLSSIWVLIAAGAGSRACLVALMAYVKPARADGLALQAGRPGKKQVLAALSLGIMPLLALGNMHAALLGCAALAVVTLAVWRMAIQCFGGLTGDVLGAAQQLAEVALLVVLTTCLFPGG